MKEKGLITINNGTIMKKKGFGELYPSVVMWVLNHLCDIDVEKNYVLTP